MAWKRSSIFSWKERRVKGLRNVREPISVRNLRLSAWTRRMSRTSRTVIWRMIVQASENIAALPVDGVAVRIAGRGGPGAEAQDRFGRADGPCHRPDVVDPQDVGAALDREERRRDRPPAPLAGAR